MDGILKKDDTGWKIYYQLEKKYTNIDIHPNDTQIVEENYNNYINNIENRFNLFPFAEFYIIYENHNNKIKQYARITQNI